MYNEYMDSRVKLVHNYIIELYNKYKKVMPNELIEQEYEYLFRNRHICRIVYTIDFITRHVKQESMILDMGSHTGYLSITLKKIGYNVIALDVNRPEIVYWKKRYEDNDIDFAIYNLLDHSDIPVKDVDNILLLEVIEHVSSHPGDVIRKIYDALKCNGFLILSTPNMLRAVSRLRFLRGYEPFPLYEFDRETTIGHFREYSPREINYVLHENDFEIINSLLLNTEEFCKFMGLDGLYRSSISKRTKRFIAKEIVARMLAFINGEQLSMLKDYYIVAARKVC